MFGGPSLIQFNDDPRGTHRLRTQIKTIVDEKIQLNRQVTLEVQCLRTPSWCTIGPAFKQASKWNWFHSTDIPGVYKDCQVLFYYGY